MINLRLIIFPTRAKKEGECSVFVAIPKDRKTAHIKTSVSVLPEHFSNGQVLGGRKFDSDAIAKNIKLSGILSGHLKKLSQYDDQTDFMTADEIKEVLLSKSERHNTDFFHFTEARLADLRKQGKQGTVKPLLYTLEAVRKVWDKPRLDFNEITPRLLQRFESTWIEEGKKINTVSLIFRNIRAMFNQAIDEFNSNAARPLILGYPFRKFKITSEKTMNRNLPIETIRSIMLYPAKTKPQAITVSIFTLCFMLFGINIKDLFYLKPSDIVGDRLQFKRFKTGRQYNIKIEPEAMEIINQYRGEKYMLWFADRSAVVKPKGTKPHSRSTRKQYTDHSAFLHMLNDNLKTIQKDLGLSIPTDLSTYFVRHSFATIMHQSPLNIPKDTISLCLGHVAPERSMKVSDIYINEDFAPADLANTQLINYLLATTTL